MHIRGSIAKGLLIALAITLIPFTAVSAQKITPGTTCKVLNQKAVFQNKTFTCIKSGKNFIWNKGVAIKKPTATPAPTPTSTPTPTPTPTSKKLTFSNISENVDAIALNVYSDFQRLMATNYQSTIKVNTIIGEGGAGRAG